MRKKTFCQLISTLIYFTLFPGVSHALPKDPKVNSGSASFKVSEREMEVKVSDQSILSYSKFDIRKGEKVKFVQESPSSCVLNKVTSKDPSKILGSLESNGKVFLVNPNGVYFGPESQVNVGSLIVSTLHMADEDFLQGKYEFYLADQIASIQNEGSLIASDSIAFISPQIQNKGLIQAKAAVFAAGKHVALDFTGDGLMQFSVEGSLKEALIEHLGEIQSSNVTMKIPAAKKAISEIVNIDGAEMGEVFMEENGIISLKPSSFLTSNQVLLEAPTLEIEGRIDASSSSEKGGQVHLFGSQIDLKQSMIDASGLRGGGEVLIGGEFQGKGSTPHALQVRMDLTSQIKADALESGDGGLVVLWSRDQTIFQGGISIKGGKLEGNGGMAETSSKYDLRSSGFVDAKSPQGTKGTWLLDPDYLTLTGGNQLCYPGCQNTDSGTHCHCGNVATADVSCDNPNSVTICSDYSCNADIVYQATYAIYVQSGVGQHGGTMTFKPCTGTYASPGGILPIYFQDGSSITTNCNTVTFETGAIPVIDTSVLNVNVTRDCSSDDGVVIMNEIQATSPTYGIVLTIGAKQTSQISTLHGVSSQRYTSTTNRTTYAPAYLTITNDANPPDPAYQVQTYGLTTSGGDIQINYTPLILLSDVFLDTTNGSRYSGGTLSTGTIDAGNAGIQSATINVGTGGCLAIDNIGASSPLLSVSLTAGSCNSSGSPLPSSINTRNGSITLNGKILLNKNTTLNTHSGGNGGDVTIATSSFNGAHNLSVEAGNGAVSLGNIGNDIPLTSVSVSSADFVTFSRIGTTGVITITPPIQLDSSGTLNTTGNGTTTGANINLGTVDGNHSITINAGSAGSVFVGSMGLTTAPLGSVTISSAPNFQPPSILTNNSSIVINPTLLLNGDTVFQTQYASGTGGSITLSSVNGLLAYDLTLLAGNQFIQVGALGPTIGTIFLSGSNVTLTGSVTTTDPSASLTINNSGVLSIEAANVNLADAPFQQIGPGEVDLSKNITATSILFAAPIVLTGNSNLTATVSSFSSSSMSGNFNTTILAVTDISLASLNVNTNTLIASTGNISITSDAISLGSTSWTASLGSVSVGASLTTSTLSINAGNGVTIGGTTTLSSTGSITATGGNVSLQDVNGSSSFTVETDNGSISTGSIAVADLNLESLTSFISTKNLTLTNTATLDAATSIITGSLEAITTTLNAGTSITINGELIGVNATLSAGSFVTLGSDALIDNQLNITGSSGSISMAGTVEASLGFFSAGNGISGTGSLFHVEEAVLLATSGNISLPQVLSETSFEATADTGSFSSGIFNAGEASFDIFGSITLNGSVVVDTSFTVQNANGLTITGLTNVSHMILGDGSGSLSGSMVFQGPVTLGILTTSAQNYSVSLLNGGEIFSQTTFQNTGEVTLQSGSNLILVFDGALISNAPTTILGAIATTVGGMSFQSLNVLGGGASLTTPDEDIEVLGAVTLNGNASFATLGGGITFNSTIEGPGGLLVSSAPGIVQFNEPIGFTTPLAYLTAVDVGRVDTEGVAATGIINMSSLIILKAAGNNQFESESSIILGTLEGTTSGFQDLTILGGSGDVSLGNVGQTIPLGTFSILRGNRALIKNIQTEEAIEIAIDTVLGVSESGTLTLTTQGGSSLGADIRLNRIDGTSIGQQGLLLNAGPLGEVFLQDSVGVTVPIASLEVEGVALTIEGSLMSITGNQNYHPPTLITPVFSTFTTSGNIIFYSSLDTDPLSSSLLFYMGGGAFTVLGNTGNSHMGNLSVLNSGAFSVQQVTANTLRVGGGRSTITLNSSIELAGLGGIALDGGPIFLGGEIDASHVFFRSSGSVSNLSFPQPINVAGETPFVVEYFNALGGPIGSIDNPIELNTPRAFNLGAKRRADFIGTPFHDRFFVIPSNAPCIVTFNGITVLDCTTQPSTRFVFDSIPKNLLYVPGIYSSWSWDNLSRDWYFKEESFYLGKNPNDRKLFYVPKTRKSKKVVIQ